MAIYIIDNLPRKIDYEVAGMVERTIQNAKNLLMLRMGELPYDRYRGFDVTLYDLPIQELRAALLPELDRVMLWEPDVEVADAKCKINGAGEAIIEVEIEININE